MESAYEDDYSRRVFMHPVEAKADGTSAVGRLQPLNREGAEGYTAALYQEETGPQERQAQRPAAKVWMKRDEYNPFMQRVDDDGPRPVL